MVETEQHVTKQTMIILGYSSIENHYPHLIQERSVMLQNSLISMAAKRLILVVAPEKNLNEAILKPQLHRMHV